MEDLCRICRKHSPYNSILIHSSHDGVSVSEMLAKTCPIDLTFDDPISQLLPQSICTDCIEVISAAFNLQRVCIESDNYFRSMIGSDQIVVKREVLEDQLAIKEEEIDFNEEMEQLITYGNFFEAEMSEEVEEPKPRRRGRRKAAPQPVEDIPKVVGRQRKFASEFRPRPLPDSDSGDNDDIWYICNFCNKKIKPRLAMLRHMRKHSGTAYPYGCEYCLERFEKEMELDGHVRSLHGQQEEKSTLFCDLCGASGDNKEGMRSHMIDDHRKSKKMTRTKLSTFRCSYCSAKFMLRTGLNNHMLSIHKEPTKCTKCDEVFSDKKSMDNHMMMVHIKLYRELEPNEIVISYSCCKCEKFHETELELLQHLEVHRSSFQTDKTKCHFCPKNVSTYEDFYQHSRYHAQPQTHECLTCKKRMPFDEKLLKHVNYHRRYDCYKVECKKCFQMLRSAKDLEIHDKIKHNKETLFICPICAKSLSSANGLDQHIRYVHNKEAEKKFACKFCSMKFVLKTKLKRHEAIHSSERPHVCEICGSSFKVSGGLQKHMKIHDVNRVKKYECTQCTMRFPTKYKLDQHSYTHSGLKPHECQFCDRAYALKGDLTKHIQKMHLGNEIYQCERCSKGFRTMVELREHQQEHLEPQY